MSKLLNRLAELNRSPRESEVPPEIRVKVAKDDESRSSRKKILLCGIISFLAVLAGIGTRLYLEKTGESDKSKTEPASPTVSAVLPLKNISSAKQANIAGKSGRAAKASAVIAGGKAPPNKALRQGSDGAERSAADAAPPAAVEKKAADIAPATSPPVPAVDKEVRESVLLAARSAEKRKAYGEALRIYMNALKTDPDNHCLLNNAASIHIRLGEYGTALALCEKALALHRNYIPALINLGITKNALGKTSEAAASFTQALEQDPTHKEAIYNLALFNEKNGKLDASAHAYQRLAVSGDLEGMIGLARVYEKQSRKKEAVRIYVDVVSRRDIPVDTRNSVLKRLKQLEE
ncbi:MAG: tetratricopeptide repeat protein [Geobacter sp.]|nr:tetratricopeptide repeat protein [Geobacter sp.]